ncbi:MAG TPA: WD40 repeat domain-containing protein, partial [Enhygromyxa sp.]|nr:WD40 repeat domain-containing protein [Enhygromyxa sp.]
EPAIVLDALRWISEQDALVDALLTSKPREDTDALRELACSNPAAASALLELREAKLDDTEVPVRFAALLERAFVRLLQLPTTIRRAVLAGLALLRAAPAPVPDRLLAAALGPATLELLERHAAEWLRRDAGQLALTHPFAVRYLATELDLHDVGPHFDLLGGLARLRQRGALLGPAGDYASQYELTHKQAARGLAVGDQWMRAVAVMQRAAGDGSLEERLATAVASARPEHLALLEAILKIVRRHSLALASDPASLPNLLWTGLVARSFAPRMLDEELAWGELRPTIRLQNSLSNLDRCHRILSGHKHPIRGCGLSRDGSVAVTFGSDGTLRIWDAQTGRSRELQLGGWCESCALTPDGHRVAVGVSERVVLIDTRTGEKIAEHRLHKNTATAMAISPDGTRVLSGDRNGLIALWNVSGEPFELGKHGDRVTRCTIASDGSFGVSGGDDKVARVWSFGDVELRAELRGHSYAVSGLALTRDGERLVSICIGEARVWDPATGVQQDRFDELGESCAGAIVVANDREVLMAEAGERITRWSLDDGKLLVRHLAHPVDMYCVAASEDGEWYLTGGADHVARLWRRADIPSNEQVGVIIQVSALLPGEQPDTVWVTSGGKGTRLLALDDQRELVKLQGYASATALACCDDRLYVAGSNKRVTLYSAASGKERSFWEPGRDWLRTIAVDRPRQRLAFAGDDKRVYMSGLDGSQLRTIAAHDDWIHALAFTPDGKLIAVDGDGHIKLWDPDGDRGLLACKSEANKSLFALALDSTGEHVAVAGAGGPIDVFSLAQTGPPVRSFEGHVGAVRGLALRSDDRVLVSAGSDCTLRLWSFHDGRALACITLGYPLTQVVFVGERLVVGDVSGNLMIFEVDWSTIAS